jgi:hypothetical protein
MSVELIPDKESRSDSKTAPEESGGTLRGYSSSSALWVQFQGHPSFRVPAQKVSHHR